ncbi:hypothetical protein [Pseudoalteromonas ardens]|uniref:Uncharacterized protein n=1 Tax=Pseudoalteromonas rubra TaxID=43658 RepID=A0A0L0EWY7_9GAMM|nr:hypothetical protein [Pseudoalteromonas sp. R96]KNC68947.1 hypothetical protein AC626_01560 [Pseudoalteromonas rubra]MDK1311102.1 hypothetical protein [Pseudoalteromonas sp. R96]
MMNSDLARHNLKLVEKSVWITAFGLCVLIALLANYDRADLAILIGILTGLIIGIVSPYLWRKDYKFMNIIIPNFLLVFPGIHFINSTDSVNVVFQFYSSVICITGCYWLVFKEKLVRYLK